MIIDNLSEKYSSTSNVDIIEWPIVNEIWSGKHWYSSMRLNNERAVIVEWIDKSKTIEPISNIIDLSEKSICDKMIPILFNWKLAIKYNLHKSKFCSFCSKFRENDTFMCKTCKLDYSWLDIIIAQEQILRENKDCLQINRGTKRSVDEITDNFDSMEI